MPAYKDPSASDRLSAQAEAKKAMLQKFLARPKADDPAVIARVAEQRAIAEAREERRQIKRSAKEAELARIAAEAAERKRREEQEAAELAAYLARKERDAVSAQAESKARALALAAEQKAKRDLRYARRHERKTR